ncbi:MAG: carbonic anhydrase [Marivibrio sp.]|uniref:carbonic anhydrase n=1 Tax=Marivibrio sp. TaxID=2039719 RepID=UPI0032EB8A3F
MKLFPNPLLRGYRDFKAGRFTLQREAYRSLAERGQAPDVLVIACCDSRAAPETIFSAAPGEIFVVRNVANLAPPYRPDGEFHSTSAALEFAVQSLRVKHVLVLGHGRCGGVKAALDPAASPLSPGDFIGKWLELLGPAAAEIRTRTDLSEAERQTELERLSVRASIENLRTFPCVSELEARGRLTLHGAWFDIADGDLWVFDRETESFRPFDD